jgi:hypothetical protein
MSGRQARQPPGEATAGLRFIEVGGRVVSQGPVARSQLAACS